MVKQRYGLSISFNNYEVSVSGMLRYNSADRKEMLELKALVYLNLHEYRI